MQENLNNDSSEITVIKHSLNNLGQLESHFRDLVNNQGQGCLHYDLSQDTKSYNILCSAMDIIEDITMAFDSYLDHQNDDKGLGYIYIFGVLEALYIQQNAVTALSHIIYEFCKIKTKFNLTEEYPELKEIREIRHWIAGHPTKSDDDRSHFITRHSVSPQGFDFISITKSNEMEFKTANLHKLIKIQANFLPKAIEKLIALLNERDQMHRDQFKEDKLIDVFKYCDFGLQGLLTDRSSDLMGRVAVHLKIIQDALQNFVQKLNARHPVYTDSNYFKLEMPILERAIKRLEAYFNFEDSSNDEDAWIWKDYVQRTLEKFKKWAIEIDDNYNGTVRELNLMSKEPITIIVDGVDFFKNKSNLNPN